MIYTQDIIHTCVCGCFQYLWVRLTSPLIPAVPCRCSAGHRSFLCDIHWAGAKSFLRGQTLSCQKGNTKQKTLRKYSENILFQLLFSIFLLHFGPLSVKYSENLWDRLEMALQRISQTARLQLNSSSLKGFDRLHFLICRFLSNGHCHYDIEFAFDRSSDQSCC